MPWLKGSFKTEGFSIHLRYVVISPGYSRLLFQLCNCAPNKTFLPQSFEERHSLVNYWNLALLFVTACYYYYFFYQVQSVQIGALDWQLYNCCYLKQKMFYILFPLGSCSNCMYLSWVLLHLPVHCFIAPLLASKQNRWRLKHEQ